MAFMPSRRIIRRRVAGPEEAKGNKYRSRSALSGYPPGFARHVPRERSPGLADLDVESASFQSRPHLILLQGAFGDLDEEGSPAAADDGGQAAGQSGALVEGGL